MRSRRRFFTAQVNKHLRLLEAIARAQEAMAEAAQLAIALEADDDENPISTLPPPPNVIREMEKTGPRTPYKRDGGMPFTRERALRHVLRAYAEAIGDTDRKAVVLAMRKLVDQGLLTEEDLATFQPETES